jgi:hypothetical protein
LNNKDLFNHHIENIRHFVSQCCIAHRLLLITLVSIFSLSSYSNIALANNDLERDPNTVLMVSGNISAESGDENLVFDMAALRDLPSTVITTNNPWVQGQVEFTGVRISDLLDNVGAQSNEMEARAANEYKFRLTGIDFDKYPVIVAYMKDGEPMAFRDLGPLWIIFPFDDYPELLTDKNKAASVWQLTDIEVL